MSSASFLLSRMLRIGPEELGREAKRVRAEDVKEVMKAHREEVKKAVYAGSTPDIDMSEVATTDMMNTTPVTSSKRTRGTDAHFWIPKANTEVRVFWAGIEGEGEHNKVRGTWHSARTTNMEWPEEKGIPGVYLHHRATNQELREQSCQQAHRIAQVTLANHPHNSSTARPHVTLQRKRHVANTHHGSPTAKQPTQ